MTLSETFVKEARMTKYDIIIHFSIFTGFVARSAALLLVGIQVNKRPLIECKIYKPSLYEVSIIFEKKFAVKKENC